MFDSTARLLTRRMAGASVAGLLVAVLAACAPPTPTDTGGGHSFPTDPLVTTTSSSGNLAIAVRSSPQPPVVGATAFRLNIEDGQGAITGLDIAVVPFMPDMGHGTSTNPTVSEVGDGEYDVEEVELVMPGLWELRMTFAGAYDDEATVSFDVP